MKLHELHQRRLESTVQLVEASLARIESAVREPESPGIVHAVENTLSVAQRQRILEEVRRFRAVLLEFSGAFELEKHSLDVRQILAAELSSLWVMLENCRPKRMKGYGVSFQPETRQLIEGKLEGLLERVAALRAVLSAD